MKLEFTIIIAIAFAACCKKNDIKGPDRFTVCGNITKITYGADTVLLQIKRWDTGNEFIYKMATPIYRTTNFVRIKFCCETGCN